MRRWTNNHGVNGLRDKFRVYKGRDCALDFSRDPQGTHCYMPEHRLGADGELLFVLRPETDKLAWDALCVYFSAVRTRDPQLADQIRAELDRIYAVNHEYELEPHA